MSYTALYRKWRPDNFNDVKGQDAVVTTLKNQILLDRIGHAYLFCGTRGTGKTTIAKIMAKAVNCENNKDGSPCNECASCRAIAAGNSMNVVEIDAASNNGVDSVREIIEEVSYSPTEGRYKVYIIDEVHMLSPGAFNALLKTLEEPPAYAMFILATTEVHKIPVTILSRCQRYDFKRISIETITERLKELVQAEQIDAEEKALRYIAKCADGALRDALSLLDQCAAFYINETLTYDRVLDTLGAVDTEIFSKLLRCVIATDVIEALNIIEEVVTTGRNLSQFVSDFTWYLRNLLLVKSASDMDDIDDALDMSTEAIERIKEEADIIHASTLMRYIRIFSDLSNDLRYATQKRVIIELAIVKLCKPCMEDNTESLLERIRVLEEKISKGVYVKAASTGEEDEENTSEDEDESEEMTEKPELPKALSEDIKKIVAMWPEILSEMHGGVKPFLKKAQLTAKEENKLTIVVKNENGNESAYLNRDVQKNIIADSFRRAISKDVDFEIIGLEANQSFKKSFVDLSKVIKMKIEKTDNV